MLSVGVEFQKLVVTTGVGQALLPPGPDRLAYTCSSEAEDVGFLLDGGGVSDKVV